MSLNIDKDNLYFIVPNNIHHNGIRVDDFMEKDFSISMRVKIDKNELKPNSDWFLFSRNGQHTGVFIFTLESGMAFLGIAYWFLDENNNPILKQIEKEIKTDVLDNFIDISVICNHNEKNISYYVNGEYKKSIDYNGLTKINCIDKFIWLGCGTMFSEDSYKKLSKFEIDFIYFLDKNLTINEINDINENYKVKYLDYNSELPLISDNIPYKENFKVFSDFNYRNKYKIWNMVDSPIFFQKFIEGNMFF